MEDIVTKAELLRFIPVNINRNVFKSYLELNPTEVNHFFLHLNYDQTLDMLIICDFLGGKHIEHMQHLIDHLTHLVSI